MCKPGQSPLPAHYLRQMARLLQMHKELHEDCIGRRYGVTGEYVRQVWNRLHKHEMAPMSESLEVMYGSAIDG